MQISGVSLALTWPRMLCLVRVLLCKMPLLQAFPFPSTGEGDTAPAFSGLRVYLQFSGKWVFPPLLWSFPPSATLTSFPAPGCWAYAPAPTGTSLARPDLFIYSSGRISSPPFGTQCAPPPSLQRVFIALTAYYSVSLFFPRWGSVCPGGYADLAQGCLWEYRSTT
jgi:hypothetical protein